MTLVWLIWRQHRVQMLITVALLLALGAFMAQRGEAAAPLLGWLPVLPTLIGMFWGAPLLAREFERGTQRLAFTQSVPRRRWLWTKLGTLSATVTAAGLALGLMVNLWARSVDADHFGDRALFTGTGVAAGAWWLFAFVLGTAAGAVIRRVIPALAVTVALFLIVLFAIFQARDTYADPVRLAPNAQPAAGALVADSTWVSSTGEDVADPPECANEPKNSYLQCVEAAGYRTVMLIQPADRYWPFQWTEATILLLGAALLTGPVAYRVLKRPV